MKTDELIALLARDNAPVSYRSGRRAMLATLALGALVASTMMYVLLGVRPDIDQAIALPMFWFKLAFPGALMFAGIAAMLRFGSPGVRLGNVKVALALPLVVVWVLALLALANVPPEVRRILIFGTTWDRCPITIAALSIPIWMAAFWALRQQAPTHLRASSAAAGLFAGACAATVYALHCGEMEAPFLATWYVLGMLIPTLLGWAFGPKLLRW